MVSNMTKIQIVLAIVLIDITFFVTGEHAELGLNGAQPMTPVVRQDRGFRDNAECAVNFHGCAIANQMRACPVCIQKCGQSSFSLFCTLSANPIVLCVKAVGSASSGAMAALCAKKLGLWRRRDSRRRSLLDTELPGRRWTKDQAVSWTTSWNPRRGGTRGCQYWVETCKKTTSRCAGILEQEWRNTFGYNGKGTRAQICERERKGL